MAIGIKLTPERIEERNRIREERLARSVSDVAEDIRRERKERDRRHIEAVRKGEA